MARFSDAIDTVLAQEGGYVNDPLDPGGETKWGISKRQYPDLDIKAITREEAVAIYKRDYWNRYRVALIDDRSIANKYFSFVVNMSPRSAGRIVQRALRSVGVTVEVDGHVGPKTRSAVNGLDMAIGCWIRHPEENTMSLLAAIRSEAAGHYRLLIERNPDLERFRKGWMNRAYE